MFIKPFTCHHASYANNTFYLALNPGPEEQTELYLELSAFSADTPGIQVEKLIQQLESREGVLDKKIGESARQNEQSEEVVRIHIT